MRKYTILAVVAAILVTGGMVAVQQKSWKGMIQARPADVLSIETTTLGLIDFREAWVLVDDLPDALKDSLTRADIEGWVSKRLKNMGLRVVSFDEQYRAFRAADRSTDERALAANDRFRSFVTVSVNAKRHPDGAIYANVSVQGKRGVFVHPGYFTTGAVWETAGMTSFTSGYDAKEEIRKAINKQLDLLAADWKKCNP